MKSLNSELYLMETRVDFPDMIGFTSGFTVSPLIPFIGGTTSKVKSFAEVFLNSTTTSANSYSGSDKNSIFFLSAVRGHLTTLAR